MLMISIKKFMLVVRNVFIVSMFLFSAASYCEVVIIVHPSNNNALDKSMIRQIFMGRVKQFPDGEKVIPIEIESGSIRAGFLQTYLGKRDAELQSYWSRQLFTGKGTPPKAYDTEADVKKLVAANPSLISFIDSANVDASVKVVKMP